MDNTGQPVLFVTFNCQGYFKVEKSAFKGQYGSSRTDEIIIYLPLKNLQSLCGKNTDYYN